MEKIEGETSLVRVDIAIKVNIYSSYSSYERRNEATFVNKWTRLSPSKNRYKNATLYRGSYRQPSLGTYFNSIQKPMYDNTTTSMCQPPCYRYISRNRCTIAPISRGGDDWRPTRCDQIEFLIMWVMFFSDKRAKQTVNFQFTIMWVPLINQFHIWHALNFNIIHIHTRIVYTE